ncbi:MAG: aminoacyl-histidine dipeptidase [Clostridia bacterium]|nr:aminoacyl-histidine dipeptidase [Clostridia bacterium]
MEKVWNIFENLAAIPHGSGNTKAISDHCVAYAKERGFEVLQDELNNVLIRVPATAGYENHETVVIQGHLDMVCEKTPESNHDFEKDGLKLHREGDWLMATDTTLGGDDGIAIAYALALLEEETPHPALELFFTVDEETGMYGAIGFDPAWIKGRKLLNIDSEDEGELTVSAAGGINVSGTVLLETEPCDTAVYEICVDGLKGGHSGAEIHRGRANANMILGKILSGLPCRLIEMRGGQKPNVITPNATALVAMSEPVDGHALTELFRREYGERDPEITVTVTTATASRMMKKEVSDRIIALLSSLPDGVQKWSEEIDDLVETSLNCGITETKENTFTVLTSLRSMKNAERDALAEKVIALMERYGAAVETNSSYPAWEYLEESSLRETVCRCYREIYGKEMKVLAIHAGLECGLLSEKLPGLDCVSLGPDMRDIHSARERISISSAERTWNLLKEILKAL